MNATTSNPNATAPSRRGLFCSGAMLLAGGALSDPAFVKPPPLPWRNGPRPPGGADADLIRLAEDYHSAKDELDVLDASSNGYPYGSAESLAFEETIERAVDRLNEAVESLALVAAQTPDGVKAKATIIQRELPYAVDVHTLSPESPEIKLVMSLMADIAGGAA